jgi:dTDP-4-amino-4,6-dideoxygalactose transaminase
LGFPVVVDGRDLIKSRLEAQNTFLKVHWRLPEAVGPEFTGSHLLSQRTLTLPVYPEIAPGERERILRALS